MAAKTRPDVDTIRQAIKGRGADVLADVGGVARDALDGKHHPCPKCGGEDRFRYDVTKEFALCNQCFNAKNGDVLAAIQWLLGVDFLEAARRVGDYLGVKPLKKGGKAAADPAKDLEFKSEWHGNLVPYLAAKRPGVTEEALVAFGARVATYKKHYPVFALPIIGQDLDVQRPVGWVLLHAMGGAIPVWDKSGKVVDQKKVKTTYGSGPGFVGLHALERLKLAGFAEVIWKCEGVSDALALWAKVPAEHRERHLVLTNAGGAGERPKWMSAVIARARPIIVPDADTPGILGAKQWALDVANHGCDATVAHLPYPVSDTRGKDLRDYLNDGAGYAALLSLADKGDVCRAPAEGETAGVADFPMEELILSRLKLVVLYETNDCRVRVFSTLLKKSTTVDPDRLTETKLIAICGKPAKDHLSQDADGTNTWTVSQVKHAIAMAGAHQRGHHAECGVGVWRGIGPGGEHNGSLVLANNTEAAVCNGDGVLRKAEDPRTEGLVLDFGDESSEDWYDFDELADFTASAQSVEWRWQAVDQAVRLFEKWNWRSNQSDPLLATGLVMATWVQSIWAFRPMAAVLGETNSGKSTFFDVLGGESGQRGLFDALACKCGKGTSEAGVRQSIGATGRAVLLDEFEDSRERQKILESLRNASRSDVARKGTATGKRSVTYSLRHIVWAAAIESGLRRQPDVNRFIQLNLLKASKEKQGQLSAPPAGELVLLGKKLLASALAVCLEAREEAIDLKATPIEGAAARQVEIFAVPAAILGCALGYDRAGTEGLLEKLIRPSIEMEEPEESDQDALLEAILSARVRCGGCELAVMQVLEGRDTSRSEWLSALEAHGVKLMEDGNKLAVNRQVAARSLLRGTEWENSRIDQVLMRIPGAERKAVWMAGKAKRCVMVPMPEDAKPEPLT